MNGLNIIVSNPFLVLESVRTFLYIIPYFRIPTALQFLADLEVT